MAIDEQTVNKPSAKEKADFEEAVISLNYVHAEEDVEEVLQAWLRSVLAFRGLAGGVVWTRKW